MSTVSDDNSSAVIVISGRLSDGKTAAAQEVQVTLAASGLEIVGGGARHLWPYASLEAAEPLTSRSPDALLTSPAAPGMALYVSDAAFVRGLPLRARQLSTRATRWNHARPWIAAAALVVLTTVLMVLFDVSPARAIANLLPDTARQALGSEVMRAMTASRRVCHSPEGDRALDRLTGRLAAASGGAKFKVVIVDWRLFNAFAVPGEQIMLTRGLLAKATTPDEIAGVLAHEMGHGIARDPETGLVRALGLTAAVQLLTGGGSGTLTNIGLMLAQLSYTRSAEHKADVTALRLLKAARIAPHGFASFFKRVRELERRTGLDELGGILRTHPATEEREKLALSQPEYPATPSLSAGDWKSLQSICEANGTDNEEEQDDTTPPDEQDI